jgi:Flp pilus assembly pilin Flp
MIEFGNQVISALITVFIFAIMCLIFNQVVPAWGFMAVALCAPNFKLLGEST